MSLLSGLGKKTTMAILLIKLKKDFSNYKKLIFLGNIFAIVLPLSLSGILYFLLKRFTELKPEDIILIISSTLLFLIVASMAYFKRQLNKGFGDMKKVAEITQAPVTELKAFTNPFFKQLMLEHKKMKQK